MRRYTLSDFDYALPPELIAQVPAAERVGEPTAARRRHCARRPRVHRPAALLARGDLVVFNDTRVIKARLHGAKSTGGRVELLVERVSRRLRGMFQIRASHTPRAGAAIVLVHGGVARPWSRATTASSTCASKASRRSSTGSNGTAKCRCRRTSRAPRGRRGRGALPDGLCARTPARSRPRRPACISTRRCWRRSERAASSARSSRCTSAPARSSRCEIDDLALHRMHAEWYGFRRQPRRRSRRRAPAAAASSPSAPRACARSNRRPTRPAARAPGSAKRALHHAGLSLPRRRPAASPISTCQARRC